ncbi:glucose/arabinose dehydrogenase [Arthrobacter sp. TE12231]
MTSKNIARPLAATALLAALALTGCSAPQSASAPSSATDTAPAPASATPSPTATSGPFGGFASAAEACTKISEQATGATLLPLSAAQGKTAELQQSTAELAETAERVPDSLKADFANLKDVAIAGVTDQTVFSSGKLQAAMAPVTQWIATNCK